MKSYGPLAFIIDRLSTVLRRSLILAKVMSMYAVFLFWVFFGIKQTNLTYRAMKLLI